MGRPKLTEERVELVKHLLGKDLKHRVIAQIVGVGRPEICHIINERRWADINKPDGVRGEYLFYKLLNGKLK
jgi:Trp operon repressor